MVGSLAGVINGLLGETPPIWYQKGCECGSRMSKEETEGGLLCFSDSLVECDLWLRLIITGATLRIDG